jgi:hypothetical protein
VIVEGTFTSIADVASTMKWGWLPVGPLITQRFESVRKVRSCTHRCWWCTEPTTA